MRWAKGEWAQQGWLWLIGAGVMAYFFAAKVSAPLAVALVAAPLIQAVLLFFRVRWAPEFLLAVCALSFTSILVLAFDKGFTMTRVTALLACTVGVVYPYRQLKESAPGAPEEPGPLAEPPSHREPERRADSKEYQLIDTGGVRFDSGFALERNGRFQLSYAEGRDVLFLICEAGLSLHVTFPNGDETWALGPRTGTPLSASDIERIRENLRKGLVALGYRAVIEPMAKRIVNAPNEFPRRIL